MVEIIESYKRARNEPRFLDRFYERFIGSDEAIAPFFVATDMVQQKFLLSRSLAIMFQHACGVAGTRISLDKWARQHGPSGLNIPERLYRCWLDSLIQTVAEFDSEFTRELEDRWRKILGKEVDYFVQRAREAG